MIKRIFLLLAILVGNIGVNISFAQVAYENMDEYRTALIDARNIYETYNTDQRPLVSLANKEQNPGYSQRNTGIKIQWNLEIDTMVYVTTLKRENSPYDKNVGSILNTKGYDLWVTMPNELNKKIIGFGNIGGPELKVRLAKVLGLPIPTNENDRSSKIITLKVSKRKLLRPSTNPNPNTNHVNVGDTYYYPYSEIFNYVEWYDRKCNDTFLESSNSEITNNHYPFTGLGYTYDWGQNTDNHYGLSEFIVVHHTDVTVVGNQTLEDYYNALMAQ